MRSYLYQYPQFNQILTQINVQNLKSFQSYSNLVKRLFSYIFIYLLILIHNIMVHTNCKIIFILLIACFFKVIKPASCPAAITYCNSCTSINPIKCTACINTGFLLSGGICYFCYQFYSRCSYCNSLTCTSCQPSAYPVGVNCKTCGDVMPYCVTCPPNLSYCTGCSPSAIHQPNNTCKGCFEYIDGCDVCLNQTVCISCFAANITIAEWNDICQNCSIFLSNCVQCNDNATCTKCIVKYTVISNNTCQLCQNLIQYCDQCSSPTACTKCYFRITETLWNSKCAGCAQPLYKCLNCLSNQTCIKCLDNYFLANNLCILCVNYIAFCKNCLDAAICTACHIGKLVIGGCTLVVGCSKVSQNILNHTCTCIECYSPQFYLNSSTNKCQCTIGHLAGEFCTEMIGCLTVIKNSTGEFCIIADVSNNFYLNDSISICIKRYELATTSATVCTQICGDGYLFVLPCDDGNLINADGCDSKCQIQNHYVCKDGSSFSPSICLYKGPIIISKIQSRKMQNLNQAQIMVTIYPNKIPNLSKMDYLKYLSLNIPANTTIQSIQYANGIINIYVNYFDSIEGLFATVHIDFDRTLLISPSTSKSFKLYSNNIALYFFDNLQQKKMIEKICLGISFTACIIFLIGSYLHKMIGVQTILVFQLAFIYQGFAELYDITFLNFKMFRFSFGQSGSIYETNNDPIVENLNYSQQYYNSTLILSILKWGTLAIFLFINLILKFKDNTFIEKLKKKRTYRKLTFKNKFFRFIILFKQKIYDFLIFPLFIGFFIIHFMLTALGSIYGVFDISISTIINYISQFMLSIIGYLIFFYEWKQLFQSQKYLNINNGIKKPFYVAIFLTHIFILTSLILCSILIKMKRYFLFANFGYFIIYLIFIIIYRPYKNQFNNIANIYNTFTILCILIFIYLPSASLSLSQQKISIIFYSILGMMLGTLAIAIIRIILEIRSKCKCKQSNQTQEKQQKKDKQSHPINHQFQKMNEQMIENLKNLSSYRLQNQLIRERMAKINFINNQRQNNKMNLLQFDAIPIQNSIKIRKK